jgi:hypothetical protein
MLKLDTIRYDVKGRASADHGVAVHGGWILIRAALRAPRRRVERGRLVVMMISMGSTVGECSDNNSGNISRMDFSLPQKASPGSCEGSASTHLACPSVARPVRDELDVFSSQHSYADPEVYLGSHGMAAIKGAVKYSQMRG